MTDVQKTILIVQNMFVDRDMQAIMDHYAHFSALRFQKHSYYNVKMHDDFWHYMKRCRCKWIMWVYKSPQLAELC